MENKNNGFVAVLVCGVLFASLIGSCNQGSNVTTTTVAPRNDYQDMRNRGHSEEDAIIFGVLKQQGYSDYEALRATKASKE